MPNRSVAAAALLLVSACGGGSGGMVTSPPPPPPAMPALLATGAAGISPLTGVALTLDGAGDYDLVAAGGTVDHRAAGLSLTIGGVTVMAVAAGDIDGTAGTWTDATRGTVLATNPAAGAATRHVRLFILGGAAPEAIPLVLGQRTDPAAMRVVTGTATWTGRTAINYATTAGPGNASTGTADITVDFDADTARLRLSQLSGDPPFDVVRVVGMRLSGGQGGYGGGTVQITDGARDVTAEVIGLARTEDTRGAFFGPMDARGRPDETGGLVVVQGSQGELVAGFTAD